MISGITARWYPENGYSPVASPRVSDAEDEDADDDDVTDVAVTIDLSVNTVAAAPGWGIVAEITAELSEITWFEVCRDVSSEAVATKLPLSCTVALRCASAEW